jgi:hypothetical protein
MTTLGQKPSPFEQQTAGSLDNCLALRFMKTQYAMVLCLILGTGAFAGHAQVSPPSSPFVLGVTNINSGSVHVWTNNAVSFHFLDAGAVNVDELDQELAKSGIHSKRLVRIIDDRHVVAEGRLLGRSWGTHANGFILEFDSPEKAKEVAEVMRHKGTLAFPKRDDKDRKG